jgi:hypothetical protein
MMRYTAAENRAWSPWTKRATKFMLSIAGVAIAVKFGPAMLQGLSAIKG